MEKKRNGGGEVSDCYSTCQHGVGLKDEAHMQSKLGSMWRGSEMKRSK